MSHVLTLKFETSSDERRDDLIRSFVAAIETFMAPGDEVIFTLAHERPTARGSRKVIEKVEWECGEPAPTLSDFGIITTQHELWNIARQLRAHGVEIRLATTETDASTNVASTESVDTSDVAPETSQDAPGSALSPIERMILDALNETPRANDASDDEQQHDDDEQTT